MTTRSSSLNALDTGEAASQIMEAAEAKKCWPCGCLHSSLRAIEGELPAGRRPEGLSSAIQAARAKLTDVQYDCLGCDVCYPANAVNALNIEGDACPAEDVERRDGWPPLPGSYSILRYHAHSAICTLTDESLAKTLAETAPGVAIVGTLQTENLGIERLILNTISNPNIRFLILCGADSRQVIGHLPGASILALGRSGLSERQRIIEAPGKRPVLRNIDASAVEHFRRTVELIDLVGKTDPDAILKTVQSLERRNPGPATSFDAERLIPTIQGRIPKRMEPDPAGYFVVYPDRARGMLSLEHYRNDGVLDAVIEGHTAAELYTAAIGREFLTRLDHAAYLGRELARAEQALESGSKFVQDAAPEQHSEPPASGCGCGSSCS